MSTNSQGKVHACRAERRFCRVAAGDRATGRRFRQPAAVAFRRAGCGSPAAGQGGLARGERCMK